MPTSNPYEAALEKKLAFDLRASWQCRALGHAKGRTFAVLMSVLAHTYDEALLVLLQVLIPDYDGRALGPFLSTAGKIDRTGAIVADVVDPKTGTIEKDAVLYVTEIHLRDDFRRLADELKLNDDYRIELFKCVQRWVVADRRLDPTFDRKDPDARRLVN